MFTNESRKLDLIEILPPSSPVLRQYLQQIIDDSTRWNVAIESLDKSTGTYRLVLEVKLRPDEHRH